MLDDYTQICEPLRRLTAKINAVIKEEVEKMLNDGIIRPSNLPWGFAVVIATNKDLVAIFCADERQLNKKMKADDLVDEISGQEVFRNLDVFTGY